MANEAVLDTAPRLDRDELLSVKEVSERGFGSVQTIRNRIRRGEIPGVQVGRTFKVRASDLPALYKPYGDFEDDGLDAAVQQIIQHAERLTESQRDRLNSLLLVAV